MILHNNTITTGRRKCAIAQIKLISGTGQRTINGKHAIDYFQNNPTFLRTIEQPFTVLKVTKKYDLSVKTFGGGLKSQTEAIQLAIAKKFCEIPSATLKGQSQNPSNVGEANEEKPTNRSILKENGFLTRDARCKERKKYGLKKSRKASQFSKR